MKKPTNRQARYAESGFIKSTLLLIAFLLVGITAVIAAASFSQEFRAQLNKFPFADSAKPLLAQAKKQWFKVNQQWHASKEHPIYQPGSLSESQARGFYQQALNETKDGNYGKALSLWQKLEDTYPALLDLNLFHQATIAEKQGDEISVQQRLKRLLKERPNSPLMAKATYELGLSYVRGQQPVKATEAFTKVKNQYPQTEYATGSLYWLGLLAQNKDNKESYWWSYLNQSPEGRFAQEIAKQLDEKPITTLTAEQHAGLGLAYAKADSHWESAVGHLRQAPIKKSWLELGRGYLKLKEFEKGQAVLARNITTTTSEADFKEAVDLLIRNTKRSELIPLLKKIAQQPMPPNGDYLLWRLAYFEPEQKETHYQKIVTHYPDGNYAPESLWQHLRKHLVNKRYTAFLENSQNFLNRYQYAQSAAKVLFWQGKIHEKQNQFNDAIQTYKTILNRYPTSYYAFRSKGRLTEIQDKGIDPGWALPTPNHYPPQAKPDFSLVNNLSGLDEKQKAVLSELEAIGASEDLKLLLTESLAELPAIAKSWAAHRALKRNVGIRTVREALLEQASQGDLTAFQPNKDVKQLLYPLYFEDFIATKAKKHTINPWIAQSLMREESFFNPLAVSSSNALGLMQLLPPTAREVAGWVGLNGFQSVQLFQPEVNITLGTRYLQYLFERFAPYGNKIQPMLAVGGYNGGPNAMAGWVASSPDLNNDPDRFVELIPYDQTRHYIEKVFGSYWNYTQLYQ